MTIRFFCPRWGSEALSWPVFCRQVKAAGYDGVEAEVPFSEAERAEMLDALAGSDLLLIGQYYQSFDRDFDQHARQYERYLTHLASARPVLINAQTGKDYFTPEQNARLFGLAADREAATGIPVYHETHRNKALFAAHVARDYFDRLPSLKITADFSHWCCVSESLLEQQPEAVALACERAYHIHSRVGHSQGPQVTDPRLPEWKAALDVHLSWWDAIVARRRAEGVEQLTINTEFGPAPYLPTIPFTNMPIASQWDINVSMLHLLKQRYAAETYAPTYGGD
ncbi:sugar phosphate isomerase/epimerase [Fibrisoma montanum]|uniref:Sugar phosphate isomerase/epimerase n=1 Tax=Fibrisoma montanum TaxID=2305895 RepID=A0A418LVN9_9BACT|nr:sugar phosphate isomerase/epimerase [Fibrisoma montanum]RIV17302.1 sugar phosphate isomerase/epimerase [Fibrisoma montanum]